MLATYPIEATDQNWTSETLLDAVRVMLHALQGGNAPPEFEAALLGDYREHFLRGPNFKKLYNLLVAKCRVLTDVELAQVLNALSEQNDFPHVFARTTACSSIKDTFPDVHSAANQLFRHAFEKLRAAATARDLGGSAGSSGSLGQCWPGDENETDGGGSPRDVHSGSKDEHGQF